MANSDWNTNLRAEIGELSEFRFGLPDSPAEPPMRIVDLQLPRASKAKPRRTSTVGQWLLALLILSAAVLSYCGINQETVIHHFPQLAVVLHRESTKPTKMPASDDNIRVWADLGTALYYCPGSASYGRTRRGHFMTQAEAQAGNFEPAERRSCTLESGAKEARLTQQ